ncbi:hypothetical protein DPMN_052584 [Dreissena polymorpha]|uniref:Peptidase S1 domain-containing protein n=2 Tax=Dreissena polymorpha TaxID=45954 RepID=A0A9D4HQ03_DREPO|nr:hypothetical protein DPMN_052584 [Dreissena polymorpha]
MREIKNKETEETSHFEAYLELYVHAKGYIPIQEDPFEKNYNGIAVHVRDGVFLPYTKHADDIHDNIRMGCAISRKKERSGTLGLFFEHVQYGMCGIASAHVLLCDKELEQCTMQMGKYVPQDQKEVYQLRFPDMIGQLVEVIYKKGNTSLPGIEIGVIAIEKRKPENGRFPDPKRGKQLDINYSSGKADKPRANNLKCVKFGSATNYTFGIIERLTLPNVARTLAWTLKSGLIELTLYNQLRIDPTETTEPFADFGDSGAPVFVIDGDGQPVCVGIVAGGISDSRTVMVTPITVILEELGISKFKTFKPNLEKLQQDMHAIKHQLSELHAIKHQLSELAQHLLSPSSANP